MKFLKKKKNKTNKEKKTGNECWVNDTKKTQGSLSIERQKAGAEVVCKCIHNKVISSASLHFLKDSRQPNRSRWNFSSKLKSERKKRKKTVVKWFKRKLTEEKPALKG